jgi:cell division protein FtsL
MRILKFALLLFVVLFLVKHRDQLHLPSRHSPEQLQERVQALEQEISRRNEIIAAINEQIAKAPIVGTVDGHTACGAPITVVDSGVTQMQAEANRLQGEINAFDKELQETRQELAAFKETR